MFALLNAGKAVAGYILRPGPAQGATFYPVSQLPA